MHWHERFENLGIEPIWPPTKFGGKYRDYQDIHNPKKAVLIAVLENGDPDGYLTEIQDQFILDSIRHGPYAARYYALSQEQVDRLNTSLKNEENARS